MNNISRIHRDNYVEKKGTCAGITNLSALCSVLENLLLLPEEDAISWLKQSRIREEVLSNTQVMREFLVTALECKRYKRGE